MLRVSGGRNIGTGHGSEDAGRAADVEKVGQNRALNSVTEFNMLPLAKLAKDSVALNTTLQSFPDDDDKFMAAQSASLGGIEKQARQGVASDLISNRQRSRACEQQGINLLVFRLVDITTLLSFRYQTQPPSVRKVKARKLGTHN